MFSATISAQASEVILDCFYVPITQEGFVADTLNGVESRYNLYGPTLYCSELIPRYYKEVYGLDIYIANGTVRVVGNDDIYFVTTDTPKEGDILFGSASARGKGYNHWALVKETVPGETITCFEQNWAWNGQAGINRIIPYTGSCYVAYTMVSKSGNLPQAQGDTGYSTVSDWAMPYVEQAVTAGFVAKEIDFQESITRTNFCQIAVAIAQEQGHTLTGETVTEQAMNLGLITSAQDGILTRQEMAVITARFGNLLGTLTLSHLPLEETYTDCDKIATWAVDSVSQLTGNGLVSPTDGAFCPVGDVTTEQAIRLLLSTKTCNTLDLTATAQPNTCTVVEIALLTGDMLQLAR